MSDLDDQKIRDLLKKSPTLTPPESFYRAVLDKIDAPSRALTPSSAPWYLGWPVKSFATACILLVLVLATREKQKGSSDLRKVVLEERMAEHVETGPQSKTDAPAGARVSAVNRTRQVSAKDSPVSSLIDDKRIDQAVQAHLQRDLTPYAANPSPFAEEDEALRKELSSENKVVLKKTARAALAYQARNTVDGAVTQGSFLDQENALKQKAQEPTLAGGKGLAPAAPALSLPESVDSSSVAAEPWKGFNTGISAPRRVVIRSPSAWADLWKEHRRGQSFSNTPPDVDFTHFMVVGVFAGTDQGLAALAIENIQQNAIQVTVYYRKIPLGPTMGLSSLTNRPYELRVIPQTSAAVGFQELR